MEIAKTLICCAKAKPYLLNRKDYPYDIPEKADFILRNEKQIKKDIIGDSDFVDGGDLAFERSEIIKSSLNGSVCFECDCKEAFIIFPNFGAGNPYFTKYIDDSKLLSRLGMNDIGMLISYAKGKDTYAYHSENVNPIAPMPISQLYKDEDCTIPLTRAPQSYCFAYYKKKWSHGDCDDDWADYHDIGMIDFKTGDVYEYLKVLVFSVRSPWLCKIANGTKDLEVRKTRIQNAGIEYK